MTQHHQEKALIYPIRFWTEYKLDPEHPQKTKEEDWVEWGKKGLSRTSTTQSQISRLKPKKTRYGNEVEAIEWSALKSHYEAWKKGEEAPVNGTPLTAWAGAEKELVRALKEIHIQTLEDFVNAPDHVFNSIALPKLRTIRQQAKYFLKNRESQSELQQEIDQLKKELVQMKKTNPKEIPKKQPKG